jgi:glycosyltransferase involved in cell wall biosynthesis
MRRLLVISHAFPPSLHSNAKRPGYLVRALLESGWEVDVATTTIGLPPGADELPGPPGLRVFRSSVFVDRLCRKLSPYPRLFRPLTLAFAGLSWPDEYAGWALQTARRTWRHAEPYNRALAFVLPASVLLSGLLPRTVGTHWTFDFQEAQTPHFRRFPRRSLLHRRMLPVLASIERRSLHQAGHIVFTAETGRQTYIQQGLAPAARTVHIPYFFDEAAFKSPATPSPDSFDIVYFGTFDWRGERNPETFLSALALFLQRHPAARPCCRFLFFGNWFTDHNQIIDRLKLDDRVVIQPAVGYSQYINKLKESPVLLLVVSSAHNLFMPSKIVDYFGAGRPILSFVPRQSEMRRVLEAAGMAEFACDELDVEAGAQAIERLWQVHRAGRLSANTEKTREWSSTVQVPRYLELLESGA